MTVPHPLTTVGGVFHYSRTTNIITTYYIDVDDDTNMQLQGINCDSGAHDGDQMQDDHQPEEVYI